MTEPPRETRPWVGGTPPPVASGSADRPPERAEELDGLRGWASVSVVLFHLLSETFGGRVDTWRSLPAATLLNGDLAVCIFFVISGEVLGRGFFAGRAPPPLVSAMLRRWLRLWIPISASCLAVFALQRAGLVFNREAGDVVGSPEWLGVFLGIELTPDMLLGALYPPALAGGDGRLSVNPFLWTMPIELAGSALVFCLPRVWSRLAHPVVALVASALILQVAAPGASLGLFVVGFLFAWIRSRPGYRALAAGRSGQAAALAAAAGGIVAAGCVHRFIGVNPTWNVILAPWIVMGCATSRPIRTVLTTRLSRGLGQISFPLYLVQFPVLVSLTSWLILAGFDAERPILSSALISIASALACLGAAILFLPIERAAIAIGRRLARGPVRDVVAQAA